MIRRKLIITIAAAAMVALTQTAQADTTGTLAALVRGGGSLTIDDKTFSGFNYFASGMTAFDPSQITVSATQSGGIDYLTWSGSISLASAAVATSDLELYYIVRANHGTIDAIDQAYSGSAVNGSLAIDETAAIGAFSGTVVGYSHLQIGDFSDPIAEPFDLLDIVPSQTVLYVTKDIGFAVVPPPSGDRGVVTVTEVSQSFHQVPEPASMLLLALGTSTLWILRKRLAA